MKMLPDISMRCVATVCVLLALLLSACSRPPVRIDRQMRLAFQFPFLEADAEGYTVILSERDAATLGSETESTTWVEESVNRNQHLQVFTATNFIDEFEFDDSEPEVPCFEDPIMLRQPSDEVIELHPAGECFGRTWFVPEIAVRPDG